MTSPSPPATARRTVQSTRVASQARVTGSGWIRHDVARARMLAACGHPACSLMRAIPVLSDHQGAVQTAVAADHRMVPSLLKIGGLGLGRARLYDPVVGGKKILAVQIPYRRADGPLNLFDRQSPASSFSRR